MKTLILFLAIWSQAAFATFKVSIEPTELDEKSEQALIDLVVTQNHVKERLKGIRYRVLSTQFNVSENDKGEIASKKDQYSITIYDYTNDRSILLRSGGSKSIHAIIDESTIQPPYSPEEYDEAVEILSSDRYFGPLVKKGILAPYEAMPGVLDSHERTITVGLMPTGSEGKNEIVGVNLSRPSVIRYESGAPATAIAGPDHCGFPNARQRTTRRGKRGTAIVKIDDEKGTNLWSFLVTRPSASGGSQGSAIDLKNIKYRGKLILARANVPILTVDYSGNACGPYRDWQYAENSFRADGTDSAPGIRKTVTAPTTIFDTGNDSGNFRGVAVYNNGESVVLLSELSAGWYRYISEFRFHGDGTIEPRFKFSAVENSCVCKEHYHHVYWRFDFDIDEKDSNRVEVSDGTTWRAMPREIKQYRNSENQLWRVVNNTTGAGYEITPGSDGTANSYGRGDVWALKYHNGQLDDSRVRTSTQANLDGFVNGESLQNSDVVFWYAGHFTHNGDETVPHLVGPILRPIPLVNQ